MVKQTADKLKNEAIKKSLEKFSTTGGVGAAVTLFVATGKTVGKYLSGELDEKEILLQVPVIWRLLLLRKTFTSWT